MKMYNENNDSVDVEKLQVPILLEAGWTKNPLDKDAGNNLLTTKEKIAKAKADEKKKGKK